MIIINHLSKFYGKRALFDKVSLSINRGEKIGFVGPNGAGKSTFFSIILGKTEPSSGTVNIERNIRIGYLPQEAVFTSGASIISEVMEGDEAIMQLKKEKEELELANKADSARYGAILHDLEFLGYFDLEHKAKKILGGLGFKDKDFNRSINEMSGGLKMRVLLAKLLTYHYDILLLDEPMNHLDLGAALWFKDYLSGFGGTFVLISHDKDFVNDVTNHTLILENSAMTKISGNYDGYQKVLDDRRKHLLKKFKEQEKKREQLKVFISRFHAQPNKASQVRAKKKTLEKMEEIVVPENRRESIRRFHFPEARQSGYRVIKLDKISKSYPSIQVYKDFSFEIIRGEKAVLAGANGAGKSTLLKILAGVIDIDEGVRSLGHNVDIGYFSQTRMEVLSPHNTVFEEAYTVSGGTLSQEAIRTILAAFLFTGEDVDKKITILSGGEKSRLILAKLLIKPPNFLLLDEPTTHLDIDAVDALIKALTQYQGTVIFISHDIHFVRSIANVVYEVKSGTVRKFPGNFDYYWQRVKDENFSNGIPKALPEKVWEKLGTKPQLEKDSSRTLPAKGNPKEHNVELAKKIKKIRKQKEKMELERNVKLRILSNPRGHHSQEMVREYSRRLEELNKIITQAEEEITKLKQLFIPSE